MRFSDRIGLAFLFVVLTGPGLLAQTGIITTYVGPTLPEDGTQATTQAIDYPYSVAPDGKGGFYVADPIQSRVYRIGADGRLSVVAGGISVGFSGDGGPAASARLNQPTGVAVDAAGDLYIADSNNFRIRKVTPAGVITTVAGNGEIGYLHPCRVAVDAAGNLYIVESLRVRKMTPDGRITTVAGAYWGTSGDGGPAISATLNHPSGIAVDKAGNIYIAESWGQRIRKVTPDGVITTFAGNGRKGSTGDGGPATSACLFYPEDIAIDPAGNLLIADSYNQRIRSVTPAGVITTVAGNGTKGFSGDGGPASSASLSIPSGIGVDSSGNLYIADTGNVRVRRVSPKGVIDTVAGETINEFGGDGGPAGSAKLNSPRSVTIDPTGNLYVADTQNQRVRKVTPAGIITTVAGNGTRGFSGDGGLAITAALADPYGVAVDAAGNLYIGDTGNHRIRKVTPEGVITTVAGNGSEGFSGDGGPATSATMSPMGLAFDAAGSLYVADAGRVRKITPEGVISTVAGIGIRGLSGDGGPATSARLGPHDLAFDTAGNLYVSDTRNCRIRKITPSGVITTVAGSGTGDWGSGGYDGDGRQATLALLCEPYGIAVDSAGSLFIGDNCNHRVRKVTSGGIIKTVVGNSYNGFSGDGGPETSAQVYYPYGVATDSSGNLYIADSSNNRIRKVSVTSTSAPQITVVTNPAGLSFTVDGRTYLGAQSFLWKEGTTHNIAVPSTHESGATRYVFANWSDGGTSTHTIRAPAGRAVFTAKFTTQYRLTMAASPAGVGSIATSPTSPDGFYTLGATVELKASPNGGYVFSAWTGDAAGTTNPRSVTMSAPLSITANFLKIKSTVNLSLDYEGAARAVTIGSDGPTKAGYATITYNAYPALYGTAVLSYRQNGITVSEVGVPASPPTISARMFIDYRTGASVPGSVGTVEVDTGLAAVNCGDGVATVTFTLRDLDGRHIATGVYTLAKGAHMARFISQLPEILPGFWIPPDFRTATRFGTLEVSSSQPLSVVAIRLTTNQRGETLLTSTPVADLKKTPSNSQVYFPQLADGGGYSTSVILMNTSDGIEAGNLRLYSDDGLALVVNAIGLGAGSEFSYSIPPGGAYLLQTDASPSAAQVGWIELTPDVGTPTPAAAGLFQYSPAGVLVTESGVPSTTLSTHVHVFIDTTGGHNTGIALGNPGGAPLVITLDTCLRDSCSLIPGSLGSIKLSGKAHSAVFVDQRISDLPVNFRGVLCITSSSPFAALTIRSLANERGDFLITTFPVADMNAPGPAPTVIPQVADGGGFATEIILLTKYPSIPTISFFDDFGAPLLIGR